MDSGQRGLPGEKFFNIFGEGDVEADLLSRLPAKGPGTASVCICKSKHTNLLSVGPSWQPSYVEPLQAIQSTLASKSFHCSEAFCYSLHPRGTVNRNRSFKVPEASSLRWFNSILVEL